MQKQLKSLGVLVTGWGLSGGCQPAAPAPPRMPAELSAASQALVDRQPDAALSDADAYLRNSPHGPSAAGARYIQGRAYEMKIATDRAEQKTLLVSAATSYRLSLNELSPPAPADPALEADVRAQLSNVAFFQDDFPTAIEQAQIAYNLFDAAQVKRFLLYRIGTSQQRLGRFDAASMTFHQIEQRFPGTREAAAAREQENQHQFFVQLATYTTAPRAGPGLETLKSPGGPLEGVPTSSRVDAVGHTIVDAGPFQNYTAAKMVRDQVLRDFPDAVVVP